MARTVIWTETALKDLDQAAEFTSTVWLFALSGVLLAALSLLFSARAAKQAVTIAIAARARLLAPSNTQMNPAAALRAQSGKV